MWTETPPFVDVFPGEKQEVLFHDGLNVSVAKAPSDGSAMLVKNDADGLIQDFPSPLPCPVTDIGIFQVKRRKDVIESAQFQKLSAVESARPAAAIEAWIRGPNGGIDSMADAKGPLLPPGLSQACLLTRLGWIREENLA